MKGRSVMNKERIKEGKTEIEKKIRFWKNKKSKGKK